MNTSAFSKNFRRIVLASVVAFGAFGASNSFAADATATATSTVIVPIAITKSADLVFGQFAPGAGGTVTVATNGNRTASGPVLSSVGSTPAAARFDVTGANNATYTISWSGGTALTSGTNTMTLTRVSALTADGATTGEVANGTLTATGAQSIYLGGVLNVAATQPVGTYTGNVTATVEYN
jgi:hypothetical protein